MARATPLAGKNTLAHAPVQPGVVSTAIESLATANTIRTHASMAANVRVLAKHSSRANVQHHGPVKLVNTGFPGVIGTRTHASTVALALVRAG